tara:strand:- start:966 stop:1448 length:483 start_codon:yes stop_codon:yes gene_type:complete
MNQKIITIILLIICTSLFIYNSKNSIRKVDETIYGSEFNDQALSNYSEILALVSEQGKTPATLQGNIINTCPKKGCWMNLDIGYDTLFVRFKDYGFFVPKDTTVYGKLAIVQGIASLDTLTVDLQRHYAEDDGKSQEEIDAITEPKYEVLFMADGVIIKE